MATYGLTKFSDYSEEELTRISSGLTPELQNVDPSKYVIVDSEDIPEAFDLREHNGVTPVRDQGWCGSCYAFGSVAAVESQLLIHRNLSTYLSIEEILACTYHNKKYGNYSGCDGGLPDGVYDFVKDNGITDNEHWKYDDTQEEFNGTCPLEGKPVITKLEDVILLPPNNADNLKAALYTYGPVSAELNGFLLDCYEGGIITKDYHHNRTHLVLIVGYGEENNTKYWSVKNSWGSDFGENGYFRIQRGVDMWGIEQWLLQIPKLLQ
ncbi:unnamed protein product [Bursaphelenchus okinawaensis]|uniref:Peptidase C1A papain C-terminal domain-containing protein n=1 Tax=Bursaphelenchus okinawaensis TaxID=465554 RepID=A0A811LJU5_9BILA|nr:unnamed protein product [Bursaphelenchus okinawaensis]CAG9127296.1 unnamed protein product [Bursaphelenchus okinawaensis]